MSIVYVVAAASTDNQYWNQAETDCLAIISFLLDLLITKLRKLNIQRADRGVNVCLQLFWACAETESRYMIGTVRIAVLCPASITETRS